jgi:hypothetical protein
MFPPKTDFMFFLKGSKCHTLMTVWQLRLLKNLPDREIPDKSQEMCLTT